MQPVSSVALLTYTPSPVSPKLCVKSNQVPCYPVLHIVAHRHAILAPLRPIRVCAALALHQRPCRPLISTICTRQPNLEISEPATFFQLSPSISQVSLTPSLLPTSQAIQIVTLGSREELLVRTHYRPLPRMTRVAVYSAALVAVVAGKFSRGLLLSHFPYVIGPPPIANCNTTQYIPQGDRTPIRSLMMAISVMMRFVLSYMTPFN